MRSAKAPISAIGCAVPISLLACMMETRTVFGAQARRHIRQRYAPILIGGNVLDLKAFFTPAFQTAPKPHGVLSNRQQMASFGLISAGQHQKSPYYPIRFRPT